MELGPRASTVAIEQTDAHSRRTLPLSHRTAVMLPHIHTDAAASDYGRTSIACRHFVSDYWTPLTRGPHCVLRTTSRVKFVIRATAQDGAPNAVLRNSEDDAECRVSMWQRTMATRSRVSDEDKLVEQASQGPRQNQTNQNRFWPARLPSPCRACNQVT